MLFRELGKKILTQGIRRAILSTFLRLTRRKCAFRSGTEVQFGMRMGMTGSYPFCGRARSDPLSLIRCLFTSFSGGGFFNHRLGLVQGTGIR